MTLPFFKAKEIYAKHNFDVLTVSKRFENVPPMGWDRGDSCIHILKWMFGLDWEDRIKVNTYVKPNYFKKQCSSSSLLFT